MEGSLFLSCRCLLGEEMPFPAQPLQLCPRVYHLQTPGQATPLFILSSQVLIVPYSITLS